jgi:hypothetical protein
VKKQLLFALFLTLLSPLIYCQNPKDIRFLFSPGVSYQGQLFGEVNLMYSEIIMSHGVSAIWGPRVGVEANFKQDNFIYAPKIGYELSATFFVFRANMVSYIDKSKVDLRILPEAGISLAGFFNLTYGYGIPTLNYESPEVTRHRFTLTANLYRGFSKWSDRIIP